MYTTIFYPLRTNPADPTPKCREQWTTARSSTKLCCVLVTGRPTAHALLRDFNTTRFRPWRMLVMDHQHGGGRSQGRFWSRVAKILPHRIFTTVPVSVFVDFKLELRQDPRLLVSSMLTSRNASFAAWRHQCALEYRHPLDERLRDTWSKDPWIFQRPTPRPDAAERRPLSRHFLEARTPDGTVPGLYDSGSSRSKITSKALSS